MDAKWLARGAENIIADYSEGSEGKIFKEIIENRTSKWQMFKEGLESLF